MEAYKDVYTVEEYKARVKEIQSAYNEISTSDFMEQSRRKLENQIKKARHKEKQIFKLLNVANIDELNKRVQEYEKTILSFSGPALYEEILKVLEEDNDQSVVLFNNAVMDIINNEIANYALSEVDFDSLFKNILKFLANAVEDKKRLYTSSKGFDFKHQKIYPSSFTKEQRERWIEILISNKELQNKYKSVRDYIDVVVNGSNNTYVSVFNWKKETGGMTKEEAQKLNTQQLNIINTKIGNKIVDMTDSGAEDKKLIMDIINHILSKNPYVFFVGNNINGIIGIFGEISGLFYLSKFLGGLDEAIQWEGGIPKNGKQPHRDIILNKIFGIQVKNTKDEFVSDVNFTQLNLETLLERIRNYLPTNARYLIENYFGTLNFNVRYRYNKKGKAYEVENFSSPVSDQENKFSVLLETLRTYEKGIDKLLNLFATTFMYLDTYNKTGEVDLNSLFLLGTSLFQTASNILTAILDGIEADMNKLQIRSSIGSNRNIVTAINNDQKGINFTQEFLKQVSIKSSFNFSTLY